MQNVTQDQSITCRKTNCYYSLFLHIIEDTINNTNVINSNKKLIQYRLGYSRKTKKLVMWKLKQFIKLLEKRVRKVECGAVVKITATELLKPDQVREMKFDYMHGILSILEDVCEVTSSRDYQVNWSIEHLVTGNTF